MSINMDNQSEELCVQRDVFEWETIKKCNNKNVLDCANVICQLISNFNGAATFIKDILIQQNEYEAKITKLEEQNKKLEKCNNCVVLKKKLDDHNEKIQTLAQVFGQITNSNGQSDKLLSNVQNDLDRVHNIFTEIIDDIPPQSNGQVVKESIYGKRKLQLSKENVESSQNVVTQRCEDIVSYETPKKKIRTTRQSPSKSATKTETQESITSPILVKSKRNINSSFGDNTKSPLANLSNRLADTTEISVVSSPTAKNRKGNEKDCKESSPSLLGKLCDGDKTPSPEILKNIKLENNGDTEDKRRSLSLLQTDKHGREGKNENVRKRSPKCMKLKQARLSFTKAKPKEPLDVSTANNFCGGMRRFSVDNVLTKEDEDEMLKIALQLSLNENVKQSPGNDDDDVIDASPANQSKPTVRHRTHKAQVHRAETSVIKKPVKSGSGDVISISDNEETMIFDSQQDETKQRSPTKKKKHQPKCSTASTSKCETLNNSKLRETRTSPKKLTRSNNSPLKNEPEYAYVEPVVRKKAEKKNLEGWGCKKCKDFYEVAFEGDEQLIKEKMNECSRHRGKFNPIRMDTPAGFWDLKMPPTQDTEAFNRRNNRS